MVLSIILDHLGSDENKFSLLDFISPRLLQIIRRVINHPYGILRSPVRDISPVDSPHYRAPYPLLNILIIKPAVSNNNVNVILLILRVIIKRLLDNIEHRGDCGIRLSAPAAL